jgi:dTMP kinase
MTAAGALPGKFITLEGVDGAGKSTHVAWLAERLRGRGREVVVTREPGGTPLGEKVRRIVLGQPMHIDTETLLMFAARREHLARVILPALAEGKWVVSDRFTDATFAYQGGGRQMPLARIRALEEWVQDGLQPDLTFVFDVPPEVAASRRGGRNEAGGGKASTGDRFETEDRAFFDRVRTEYLRRAAEFPGRIRVVDASCTMAMIQEVLEKYITSI